MVVGAVLPHVEVMHMCAAQSISGGADIICRIAFDPADVSQVYDEAHRRAGVRVNYLA